MNRMKSMVLVIVMLVLGLAAPVMASTFQPEPGGMAALDASGNINWSGLFASIERYKPGANPGLYTHSPDAAAGGSTLFGAANGGNFLAVQGLALDAWGNFPGTARFGNEKVSAVVAALAGFFADDRLGLGNADIHLSFNSFGSTYNPISPVPLPPSLWIFFSGLGLLGVARRRWWRQ